MGHSSGACWDASVLSCKGARRFDFSSQSRPRYKFIPPLKPGGVKELIYRHALHGSPAALMGLMQTIHISIIASQTIKTQINKVVGLGSGI